MDAEKLEELFKRHPRPWRQGWTCTDNGSFYDTIEDAKGAKVFNPASGTISDELFEILLDLGNA